MKITKQDGKTVIVIEEPEEAKELIYIIAKSDKQVGHTIESGFIPKVAIFTEAGK